MNYRMIKCRFSLAILVGSIGSTFATPPAPPVGFQWMTNATFTDEFNGTSLDLAKWYNYHPTWAGRPPAKFMTNSVSMTNGMMQIRNGGSNPHPSPPLKSLL